PARNRNQNPSGLGRAIINRKVKDAHRAERSGLFSVDLDTNRLKSVTQERDLDEFLNTAELAGTDFTAERRNVKVINQTTLSHNANPYLLTPAEEEKVIKKQNENAARLRVPRRPPWKKSMKHEELDLNERTAFLEWRRNLAQLQETDNMLLTPFERNIEVWRQLWRVLERSHLVVQIVDARNPLRFRCKDLEDYVRDVEGNEGESGSGPGKRTNMLLINKADLLTLKQRQYWADYFEKEGIPFAFYSAATVAAIQLARREAAEALQLAADTAAEKTRSEPESEDEGEEENGDEHEEPEAPEDSDDSEEDEADDGSYFSAEEDGEEDQDPRTKILSVDELEALFLRMAPNLGEFRDSSGKAPERLVLGLVGYPNVGKSSTINSLLGEKKVSVSATPGKTKHFQTINLSDTIVLCDCPGLVFPQFAATKAELVCDGVLPIDQLREYTGPVALIARRIPQKVLETIYGLSIKIISVEERGTGKVRPEDFLQAYAIARGFTRAGQGNPDEARAARHILKDYVNGKLLYCNPPPSIPEEEFNDEMHEQQLELYATKKKAPLTRVGKNADTYVTPDLPSFGPVNNMSQKSRNVDESFFQNQGLSSRPFTAGSKANGKEVSRVLLYPNQVMVADDGTPRGLEERIKAMADIRDQGTGKKGHKKAKRVKHRSGRGYD
ncbi:P-loop containing nucleoside triphosphate hydrolase protein, partial [Coprinopsis marcescibilis]